MALQTHFFHNVYFWLWDNADPADAQKIAEGCRQYLTNIPGVLRLTVGFPAGTNRGIVDNSYAVALMVEFPDREAHDAYQVHVDHKRFMAECSKLSSSVQVYDWLGEWDV